MKKSLYWKVVIAVFLLYAHSALAVARDSLHATFSGPTISVEDNFDADTNTWRRTYIATFDASGAYDADPPLDGPGPDCIVYPDSETCYEPQALGYFWDFGDGKTGFSTSPVISHTYDSANFYNVTLWLRVFDETSARLTHRVAIGDFSPTPPEATTSTLAIWKVDLPLVGEVGQSVAFATSGTFAPPLISNITDQEIHIGWNFGDGCTYNSRQFWLGYTTSPILKLFIWDGDGTATQTQYWDGSNWRYSVSVTAGNQCVSTGSSVSHVYADPGAYTVRLRGWEMFHFTTTPNIWNTVVYDGIGTQSIYINTRPIAVIKVTSQNLFSHSNVQFVADKSSDADAHALKYYWDFGDGAVTDEKNPSHAYQKPGEYVVTLIVSDDYHASDPVTMVVTVKEGFAWMVPVVGLLLN